MAGTSRVNREVYARFCGRLEVKSLRPTRQSPGSAQKFLSTHAAVYNTFNVQRHLVSAQTHRALRADAMTTWRTAVTAACVFRSIVNTDSV